MTDPAMTAAATSDLPLAETLDEATLRQVFPDAPAELAVPRDVNSIFRARMRAVGGDRRTFWLAAGAVLVAAGITAALAGNGAGWFLAAAPPIAVAIVAFVQYRRASGDFFTSYARARGLTCTSAKYHPAKVPLFRKGDERTWPVLLTGTIAGRDASVMHYTYTDVSEDSEGRRTETDYDFTCVHFPLPTEVAARYSGVYCSPRKLGFGKVQDALQHDRKVELESAEFAKRYTLRVADDQDDVALYELFSTTFVHRLATELHVTWEQRGADLVIWKKGHECEAADLDRMCLEAWHVLHRYLEEWR